MRSRSGRESSQSRMVSLNFPLENTHRDHSFSLPGRDRRQSCPGRGDSDPDPVPPSPAPHCEGTERARTNQGGSLAAEGRHRIHLHEGFCSRCCVTTKAPAALLSQFRAGMCLSLPSIRAEPAELCPTAPSSAVLALQPAWIRKATGLGWVSLGEEARGACGACLDARSPQGTPGYSAYASLLKASSTRAAQWPYPAGGEGCL